jgi:uncharacterized protein YbjT (DUF2867 family)
MRVFLTGGTGYVGSAILEELSNAGHDAVCLVRDSGRLAPAQTEAFGGGGRIMAVKGDLLEPETYREALTDCDAVIHLVGIIRERPSKGATFERVHTEGTKALLEACARAGFGRGGDRRFIHMSALGAGPASTTGYFKTKWQAEQAVRHSGIPHVIFRPSVIFGAKDEFVNMLNGLVRLPLTPVIGDGEYRLQPISLRTVSEAFVKALTFEPVNRTFDMGGPDRLTYNQMLREIGAAGRRKARLVHIPLGLMKPVVAAFERFPFFPITRTQLSMLLEESICREGTPFYEAYGCKPIPFAEGIREFIR